MRVSHSRCQQKGCVDFTLPRAYRLMFVHQCLHSLVGYPLNLPAQVCGSLSARSLNLSIKRKQVMWSGQDPTCPKPLLSQTNEH